MDAINTPCLTIEREELRITIYTDYQFLYSPKLPLPSKEDLGNYVASSPDNRKMAHIRYAPEIHMPFWPICLYECYPYYIKVENRDKHRLYQIKIGNDENVSSFPAENIASVSFINALGTAEISIRDTSDGKTTYLYLSIIPKKIDFEDDYIKMTKDVSDYVATSLLLISGTFSTESHSKIELDQVRENTALERFFLIRQYFMDNELIDAVFTLISHPLRTMKSERYKANIIDDAPRYIENDDLIGSVIDWRTDRSGKAIPWTFFATRRADTTDNASNQLVKSTLEEMLALFRTLQEKKAYPGEELQIYARTLEFLLSLPFFKGISPFRLLPSNKQFLIKSPGYNTLFEIWNRLSLSSAHNWEDKPEILTGALGVDRLYEYWLFIFLFKTITGLDGIDKTQETDQKPHLINRLLHNDRNANESCIFFIPQYRMKLYLFYNKEYRRDTSSTIEGSYSLPLRPDFSLLLVSQNQHTPPFQINFDAKYRLVDYGSYNPEDIAKMHTYNDAIRQTHASYILYPGTKTELFSFYNQDNIPPSTGAIPVTPKFNEKGQAVIRRILNGYINHFSTPREFPSEQAAEKNSKYDSF